MLLRIALVISLQPLVQAEGKIRDTFSRARGNPKVIANFTRVLEQNRRRDPDSI
jgi:hypothetical protein